jgi:hypothetical protein
MQDMEGNALKEETLGEHWPASSSVPPSPSAAEKKRNAKDIAAQEGLLEMQAEQEKAQSAIFAFSLVTMILYTAVGTVGFCMLYEWSVADGFYYTIVTLTTVGYGDINSYEDLTQWVRSTPAPSPFSLLVPPLTPPRALLFRSLPSCRASSSRLGTLS